MTCPICLDAFPDISTKCCMVSYHNIYLSTWVDKIGTCPTCRYMINVNSLIHLVLDM